MKEDVPLNAWNLHLTPNLLKQKYISLNEWVNLVSEISESKK